MVVVGSIEHVKSIFDKYGVTMEPANFAPDGFVFCVRESGLGFSPLIRELRESRDVFDISYARESINVS